ncbi:HEAT repeat domain-containing protein [Leisingera aquaemixtae]|uniref:HEAT repeat domain-containing protein n=1 Tax=Leisingera aquaemixtae TaxID=1396826 RepID=UPI0021A2B9F1|nr:hypothetical protein [Leisingera aquaemixtae]UWQ44971.1 hypothetical protein K3719_14440 [Leisingera aquaemixtae]
MDSSGFTWAMIFRKEIKRFRDWASRVKHHSAEWELEYPDWPRFEAAVFSFLNETDSAKWEAQDWHDLLYAVARDNECEKFIERISEDQSLLKKFVFEAMKSDESEAKWQVAEYLGQIGDLEFAEPILLFFVEDADEYVRRRSLTALSVLGSKETERLAILAWETGRLYPRIRALHALNKIGSPRLEHLLELAKQDGRVHLLANASKLQTVRKERD